MKSPKWPAEWNRLEPEWLARVKQDQKQAFLWARNLFFKIRLGMPKDELSKAWKQDVLKARMSQIKAASVKNETPMVKIKGKMLVDSGASFHIVGENQIKDPNSIKNYPANGAAPLSVHTAMDM